MLFLNGGLYVEPDPDKVSETHPMSGKPTAADRKRYRRASVPTRVHTHTDPLDAWVYFQEGSSTEEVPKPAFAASSSVLKVIDFLQKDRKPGWFRFGSDLLNLASDAQKALTDGISRTITSTRSDHAPHSLLHCYAGAWGFPILIIYSCPRGMEGEEARRRMGAYLMAKKHQLRSDRALGLLVDEAANFIAVHYHNELSQNDPELDQLVIDMGLVPPERMGRVIPPSAHRSTHRLRGKKGNKGKKPKRR